MKSNSRQCVHLPNIRQSELQRAPSQVSHFIFIESKWVSSAEEEIDCYVISFSMHDRKINGDTWWIIHIVFYFICDRKNVIFSTIIWMRVNFVFIDNLTVIKCDIKKILFAVFLDLCWIHHDCQFKMCEELLQMYVSKRQYFLSTLHKISIL